MKCDVYRSPSRKDAYLFVRAGKKPTDFANLKAGDWELLKSGLDSTAKGLAGGPDPELLTSDLQLKGFYLTSAAIKAWENPSSGAGKTK